MKQEKASLQVTCPWCGRPQTIAKSGEPQRCRQCKNPFIWDPAQARAIIAPKSVSRQHSGNPANPAPAPPRNTGASQKHKKIGIHEKPTLYAIIIIICILCAAGIYFGTSSNHKHLAPEDAESKSSLEEISKQLKALSE